jgi:hypothetical protein
MKSHVLLAVIFGLTIGLAASPAYAQAGGVQAKIPFDFIVSGKVLPAGEYTMFANPHQVKIADVHHRVVAMVLANDASDRPAGKDDQIIFHCYRDHCFLSEIWSSIQWPAGRQVLTSRAEAELAREESGKYFAVVGQRPQK